MTYPLYYPRYGMIAMIGLFILAGCGIARLPKIAQPIVIVLLAIGMLRAPDPTIKGPFRAAGAYLKQWMEPGEYVAALVPDSAAEAAARLLQRAGVVQRGRCVDLYRASPGPIPRSRTVA